VAEPARGLLDLAELAVGRRFGPYPTTVDDAQLAAYAAVTGSDPHRTGVVPAGNAEVLLSAEVEAVSTERRRPYVELRSTVVYAGETVLEVLTRALWPAPEAAE
jgi:hypothetical protein